MKRSFWISISLVTFFVGVSGAAIFFLTRLPEDIQEAPLLINCESKSFPGISKEIRKIEKGKSGYFPKDSERNAFINGWDGMYGKFLTAMKQNSLLDIADDSEIYRFLWLRTFHHPIVVTVKRKDNLIMLSTTETNGAGGYEPREIIKSVELKLKEDEYCKFLSLLNKTDFWRMTEEEMVGTDGARWMMEGIKNGQYHLVERQSPEGGHFRETCIYLLTLSGLDVDKLGDELY